MFRTPLSRLISFPVIHACFLACSADISSCMLDEPTVSQTCGKDEYLKKLSKIDEGPKAHKPKKIIQRERARAAASEKKMNDVV